MLMLLLALAAAAPDSALRYGGRLLPAAADTAQRLAADTARAASAAAADSAAPLRLVAVATLAAREGTAARVEQPAGLALDSFRRVLVSDQAFHRLQQLEPDGAPRWQAGTLGSGTGELRRPAAVVPLGTLEVAVLDVENRRVLAYDLFGRLIGTRVDLAALERDDPRLRVDPVALAADRGGALVLADAERDRLVTFDFAGRLTGTIGGIGARPGSFRGLRGVAVTPRGELVTAERGNARVQRLTAFGRALESWPLAVGAGRARLAVAADDSGRVVVADEAAGRLWLFGPGGRMLAALDGLEGPAAVVLDGWHVLVAEARGGRVRRFRLEPAPGR